MTKDDALYIKIETPLKNHVNQYVKDKNVKGGLSEMVRQMLIKKTAYKTPKV